MNIIKRPLYHNYHVETESQPRLRRALYSYKATSAGQLSFKEGDVITVHSKGWWKGERNGEVGLFPSSYMEPWPPTEQQQETTRSEGYSLNFWVFGPPTILTCAD